MKSKNIRLTLKTAQELVKKEFGFCGRLTTEAAAEGVYIYAMQMGRFDVTVENDWFEKNGLIVLKIDSGSYETIRLYYDPDTLDENIEAIEKNRQAMREEWCESCNRR